jgi:hypothetical protein
MNDDQKNQTGADEDVEGHVRRHAPVEDVRRHDELDVEGHVRRHAPVEDVRRHDELDVEGHVMRQAPAEDLSDDGIDFERPR